MDLGVKKGAEKVFEKSRRPERAGQVENAVQEYIGASLGC
jgi:hypothetical protein